MTPIVPGGVTSPKGFRAAGVACGIKRRGTGPTPPLDLAMIVAESPVSAAGVFTTNKAVAAPVVVTRDHLSRSGGRAQAIVINSGCANACTGEAGMRVARDMAASGAVGAGCTSEQVLIASTGVIGVPLDIARVRAGVAEASRGLTKDGGDAATRAIMTTDPFPKSCAAIYAAPGGTVTVGGMAKGSGMIEPKMATMIGVLTTDARVAPPILAAALRRVCDETFNAITVDGECSTHWEALDATFYLRIADELYLKRCLVGGLEKVYEIGHDFRNEGLSRFHNPEFTMAEWYEAYADYNDMAALTEEMLATLVHQLFGTSVLERHGATLSFDRPFARKDYYGLVKEHAGVDLTSANDADLRAVLKRHNTPSAEIEKLNGAKLVDEVFKTTVEPKLVQPTFVLDYPVALSPLAKPKRGDPSRVERWELFVQHRELANAFSELNDPDEQRRRFEQQGRLRAAGDVEAQQLDEDFIRALEYGMPPAGGVGMGVDRLTMILADQTNIRDVILFPMLRPE